MATGTLGGAGREYHESQTHYLKRDIAFTQSGNLLVGTLPPNCVVLRSTVYVKTAFNAATTNTISIGTIASGTAFGSALAAGAIALVPGTVTASAANPQADTDVVATYSQTGAAATAGVASVIVEYAAAA